MTLVLSYLDSNVTVHVADRRLSMKVGNRYEPVTEDAVKVALVRGTILVSYAGRSQVQGLPTPRWIETRLVQAADGELKQLFPKLAQRLTDVFNDDRYKDDITIATVSGWALDEQAKLIPVIGALTNQDPNTFARLREFHGVAATAAEAAPDDAADIANVFVDQIRIEADRDGDAPSARACAPQSCRWLSSTGRNRQANRNT